MQTVRIKQEAYTSNMQTASNIAKLKYVQYEQICFIRLAECQFVYTNENLNPKFRGGIIIIILIMIYFESSGRHLWVSGRCLEVVWVTLNIAWMVIIPNELTKLH